MQTIHELLEAAPVGQTVTVQGWVRTSRFAKNVSFVAVTDGTDLRTIQVVLSPPADGELRARLGVGASLKVTGEFVASPGPGQPHEVKATPGAVEIIGDCDPAAFPVQKKEASAEFYRTIPHLRVRTAEYQRIFRARNTVSMAIHRFFQERDFMWVHTPVITASDCEGAGEMFRVTTDTWEPGVGPPGWTLGDEEVHFFGKPAFLTVSGQLDVEPFACAFTRVYTFGPTFRAENSNTARHAAEFWMIEPEIAFATKDDVMDLAEGLVRACAASVGSDKVGTAPFHRVTYTRAMEILEAATRAPFYVGGGAEVGSEARVAEGKERREPLKFEHPLGWGQPLQTEHERFLSEVIFQGPVFVTDYPATLKPFYMRLNHDAEVNGPEKGTVACFDLLVPGVGEIIGGSQREERLDILAFQLRRCGLKYEDYQAYMSLREYGTVPHGGFGLGLERILMWLLDVPNIRDVLPYPRTPGSAV